MLFNLLKRLFCLHSATELEWEDNQYKRYCRNCDKELTSKGVSNES